MTTTSPRRRLPAIGNGILIAALDLTFVAATATLLWVNGRSSVIDVPVAAIIVIALIGGFILAVRRGISLRRRTGLADPGSALSERTAAISQIVLLGAGLTVWKVSGFYELGWGCVVGAIGLVVGNAILLMSDVTTRSAPSSPRQADLRARRLVSVEVAHILAGVLGVTGIVITTPIHLWRGDILNGTTLLIAAAIGISVATVALLSIAVRSARTNPDRVQP